jgi:hypothetical protein
MPNELRRLEPNPEVVHLQRILSSLGYFKDRIPNPVMFLFR